MSPEASLLLQYFANSRVLDIGNRLLCMVTSECLVSIQEFNLFKSLMKIRLGAEINSRCSIRIEIFQAV